MSPKYILRDLVLHLLRAMDFDPSIAPSFIRFPDPQDVWGRLLFCILSSQVRVSSAAKATDYILTEIPFFGNKLSTSEVYEKSRGVLTKVGYRFPDGRARQIGYSWFAFAQIIDDLYDYLDTFHSDFAAREAVTRLFPGLGLKQASMFLRDIGYSSRLCILDTHLLWYCTHMGHQCARILTPKRYIETENYLLGESDTLGVPPNVFDSAIWVAVTTFKAQQCMMRFA